MIIETKYNLGDRFWHLFKAKGAVHIYQDKIIELTVNASGKVLYYGQATCEEIPEEQIILYEETDKLVEQIKNLLEK